MWNLQSSQRRHALTLAKLVKASTLLHELKLTFTGWARSLSFLRPFERDEAVETVLSKLSLLLRLKVHLINWTRKDENDHVDQKRKAWERHTNAPNLSVKPPNTSWSPYFELSFGFFSASTPQILHVLEGKSCWHLFQNSNALHIWKLLLDWPHCHVSHRDTSCFLSENMRKLFQRRFRLYFLILSDLSSPRPLHG